jgi:AcrR family transcriptional regulator
VIPEHAPASAGSTEIAEPPVPADVAEAPGSADVAEPPVPADVAASPGSADVAAPPGSADVAASPGSADVAAPPVPADVASSPGSAEVIEPPMPAEVVEAPGSADVAARPELSGSSVPPRAASAAPRRSPGVHSRGGNAMERTRAAVLDGAARAVEKQGARRATMGDIAVLAGIAKATLYNHFRAKEAVYAAAVEAGVRALAAECTLAARDDLAEALALAAERIGGHPALRRVASDEPLALAALVTPGNGTTWRLARDGVRAVLDASGRTSDPAAVEIVLRWLVSFVADGGADVARQAGLIAAAIPPAE